MRTVSSPCPRTLVCSRVGIRWSTACASGFRFPDELETLPEILARHGYRSAAFVSAFPLDSRFGLDDGFEVYDDAFVGAGGRPAFLIQERPAAATVERARRWIESVEGVPSFAWVQLYEPHFPYEPTGELARRRRFWARSPPPTRRYDRSSSRFSRGAAIRPWWS